MSLTKSDRRQRIKFRIRKIVSGTATKPRLSVFRSNKEIYAQLVDDLNGVAKDGQTFLTKENIIHTNIGWNYGDKLVIAYLPLNNAPVLDGVPVLPALHQEDEAEEIFPVGKHGAMHMPNREMINNALRQQAYNKAKEKYKYTEEDVRNIIMHSFLKGVDRGHYSKEIEDRIIQSFQQPKLPIAFECEIEISVFGAENTLYDATIEDYVKLKTIINSEGRTEWVGKYIY